MMGQDQNNKDDVEIDLKEIFMILLDRLWIILLAGVLMALLAGVYTKVFVTPMYTSTTKLYVINKQSDNATVTYSDLQTGTSLTQDYVILVTGSKVLTEVIDNLKLDMTVGELAGSITASTPQNTRFIVISVENTDPVIAQQIAESVAEVSSKVVVDVMNMEKVNIAEEANLPGYPSSPNLKKNVVIGGTAGVFLTIVIIILVFLMNDRIRNADDVEKYLGLTTLGSIPVLATEEELNKKKKKKSKKKADIKNLDLDKDDDEEESE